MDIKILKRGDHQWIHSVDFYQHSGLHINNYMRWLNNNICYNVMAFKGLDYFPTEDIRKATKGYYDKYYLRIGFARELCTVIGTSEAKRMKEWLMKIEGIK